MEYISNGMPSDFVYVVPESIEVGTYHDSPVKHGIRRTNVNKTRISSICDLSQMVTGTSLYRSKSDTRLEFGISLFQTPFIIYQLSTFLTNIGWLVVQTIN